MQHGIVERVVHALLLQRLHRIVEAQPFADAEGQLPFLLESFVNQKVLPGRTVLRGGHAPARSVGQRDFGSTAALCRGWRRHLGENEALSILAQYPRRLTLSVEINLAAFRSFGLRGHSRRGQRRAVGDGDVAVDANENRRMPVRHHVDVLAGGKYLSRPQRVVPTAAQDPLSGWRLIDSQADAVLHVQQVRGTGEIDLKMTHPRGSQVYVGVVESRHHKMSAQVDDLSLTAFELANFVVGTDGHDASVAHCNGLRTRRSRLGVDVSVDEDYVGWLGVVDRGFRVG